MKVPFPGVSGLRPGPRSSNAGGAAHGAPPRPRSSNAGGAGIGRHRWLFFPLDPLKAARTVRAPDGPGGPRDRDAAARGSVLPGGPP
ncbi:hypothetical protein CAC01_25015 [Streptomyces sp. CLI2509]|nr:hypothetical protein CAC01_25015 [Streptomyces sp. CLI2509]